MNKQEVSSMAVASDDEQLQQLLLAHERIARFLREIDLLPDADKQSSDWRYTECYNQLASELHNLETDLHLAKLIPKRLSHPHGRHLAVIIVVPAMAMGALALLPALHAESYVLFLLALLWLLLSSLLAAMWLDFCPTVLQVRERSVLLLAHVKENIVHLSPQVAAQLEDHPTSGTEVTSSEQTSVPVTNQGDSDATAQVKAKSVPPVDSLPGLTRRHLETRLHEQKRRYDQLTERIASVTEDEGREMDGERKLTLKARRQELIDEREQVQALLETIEGALNDSQAVERNYEDRP